MILVIFKTLLWFGLVGTTIFNPLLGGVGLLAGYAFGDKIFALTNISHLIRFPLFITEPVLLVLFIHAVIKTSREKRLGLWPLNIKSPWLWFYAVGILNVLFGLLYTGPILVFRDAMIVFYGIVTQLTIILIEEHRHIKILFFTIVISLLARLILSVSYPVFSHLNTTYGMFASFAIIGCFCTWPLWGRYKPAAFALIFLFVAIMTTTEIRTVWAGFILSYVFIVGLLLWLKAPLKFPAVGSAAIFSSLFLTVLFLKMVFPAHHYMIKNEFLSMFMGVETPNLMTRIVMWEDAIEDVVPATKKVFDTFDRKVLNPYMFGSEERPESTIDKSHKSDLLVRDPTATDIILEYVKRPSKVNVPESWSKGAEMPEKVTVVVPEKKEEVEHPAPKPVEIVSKSELVDLPTKEISAKKPPEEEMSSVVEESSKEASLEKEPQREEIPLMPTESTKTGDDSVKSQKTSERPPFRDSAQSFVTNSKILRTLFGVPFGVRFIPERISRWHKANRYDPHNSIVAVLYRTGLVGLGLFLFIIGRAFYQALKALKKGESSDTKYYLMAIMSCLVYHLGQSLLDVTLENPFRGIPFWVLLGLMMVLTSMMNKEKKTTP